MANKMLSLAQERDTHSENNFNSSEDYRNDVVFKESNALKHLIQNINSTTTYLYLGGWFGCRAGKLVGKNKDYGLNRSSIGFSLHSLHAFMPMLKEIFKVLKEGKFEDLHSFADGFKPEPDLDGSKSDNDNYVYFFMPGEKDLEAKFRIALIVYESGKLGFCRFFIPSAYEEFNSDEWTLARGSKLIFDTRLQLIQAIQNLCDVIIFSTSRRSQWSIPVFHLYHQYFYMTKKERKMFFTLPFSRKKILASRALEFMPQENSSQKLSKNQFFQLVGDLKESLLMISEISDYLADFTIAEGDVYLFTR